MEIHIDIEPKYSNALKRDTIPSILQTVITVLINEYHVQPYELNSDLIKTNCQIMCTVHVYLVSCIL